MIYTVFLIVDPDDIEDVRYVGFTTQMLNKRMSDIVSVSRTPTVNGYFSPLSEWIRELEAKGRLPLGVNELNTTDREEAEACRISTFNCFAPTGRLLNSHPHNRLASQLEPYIAKNIPGKVAQNDSKHCRLTQNRKSYMLGVGDRIWLSKNIPKIE
jgi:hypothetical protein